MAWLARSHFFLRGSWPRLEKFPLIQIWEPRNKRISAYVLSIWKPSHPMISIRKVHNEVVLKPSVFSQSHTGRPDDVMDDLPQPFWIRFSSCWENRWNLMGISWGYHGNIMGRSRKFQYHPEFIYIYLSVYLYIYIYAYTYIYTYFGISWISIEMIKLHKAVIKPSHPPKSGLCH